MQGEVVAVVRIESALQHPDKSLRAVTSDVDDEGTLIPCEAGGFCFPAGCAHQFRDFVEVGCLCDTHYAGHI